MMQIAVCSHRVVGEFAGKIFFYFEFNEQSDLTLRYPLRLKIGLPETVLKKRKTKCETTKEVKDETGRPLVYPK